MFSGNWKLTCTS